MMKLISQSRAISLGVQCPACISSSYRKVKPRGFTLIELLVVIGIIAMLLVIATPAIVGVIGSSRLTTAGEQVVSFFSSAQQIASSEGRSIEVRIYQHGDMSGIADGSTAFRSMVLFKHYEIGEPSPDPDPAKSGKPLTESISLVIGDTFQLPDSVVIGADPLASSLIGTPLSTGLVSSPKIIRNKIMEDYVPTYTAAKTVSIIFRPDGTNLSPSSKWFLTLAEESEIIKNPSTPALWKNFYCVQIDPVNGRVTSYRP